MFSEAVRAWFESRHRTPTRVQELGWPRIASGEHALLCAPTGSGKTLAAFLSCIDRLGQEAAVGGTRVLYVSPLKALAYDIERNLTAPLAEIAAMAAARGLDFRPTSVGVRTGDTTAAARRRQLREPPEILITTPESLYLLLTSSARSGLEKVDTVIVDEIHALVPNKRGAHLALSLERLASLCRRDPQRIGLSATQRPLEEVARYLGGDRPVAIVDAGETPRIDLAVVAPAADMRRPALAESDEPGLTPQERTSLMPSVFRQVYDLVVGHRSTIVFVNSRRQAERIAHQLNETAGAELARAHHGSVARGERLEAEDLLSRGLLRCICATSSLELGIDMSAVDLVIQVESPGSVARGLQRIGRAGHAVGAVSRGRIMPIWRGDLVEAAAVCRAMLDGEVEETRVPRQPLDVLAQQIVAMAAVESWPVDALHRLVRRAHGYRDLTRTALEAVLDMLSGRYPADEMADLAPRLAWDRAADTISARRGARIVALTSGGTIPDRGLYAVHLGAADGPRVGELDEEMVYESRAGDTFLLGATSWRIEEIGRDRVIVSPAPGEPGRMPFWKGDRPGRPAPLGLRVGALIRRLDELAPDEARDLLAHQHRLDGWAIDNLVGYIGEQREATGALPTDRAITIERFRDELGDFRVCILSPLGARVHAPWALAIESELRPALGAPIQVLWNDDGIAFRLPASDRPLEWERLLPDPDRVEAAVTSELAGTPLFASHFRENAARALLLPRRRAGQRTPLYAQRLRSQQLLGAAQKHPGFPIVLETYREILRDVFDLPALVDLLRAIRGGAVRVDVVETRAPSPFARALAFAYTIAFLYEGDNPVAERRAQALSLDRALLAELLGQADLRQLLDPEVIAAVDRERQALVPDRRARDADELEDLLRRLGALSAREIAARADGDPAPWIAELERAGRAEWIEVAGERRLVSASDAGRHRAALGGGEEEALAGLLLRWARQRGPFQPREAAARFGVPPERAGALLAELVARGEIARGGFLPGGTEPELCHPDVLRELRRRTLDELRSQVAPVETAALGRFLPTWQGVGSRPGRDSAAHGVIPRDPASSSRGDGPGGNGLRDALRRLIGIPLPLGDLDSRILPARVPDYRPDMLDQLGAMGEIVWVGAGRVGARDGRIALYDRERLPLVATGETPPGEVHEKILAALGGRGALFQTELEDACGVSGDQLGDALWDLVWAGLVTNDTFAPLRSWMRGRGASASTGARRGTTASLRRGRAGSVRTSRFAGGGRWSLVAARAGQEQSATERALARALLLLDRYGVVSREAAAAEEVPGGFAALAPVFRMLEDSGRVRRGYFASGLDGRQFAVPAAIDRLRAPAIGDAVILAAADPANPYGAILPWPEGRTGFSRRSGAVVVLWRGQLAWYWEAGGKSLVAGSDLAPDELAEAMRSAAPAVARAYRRRALRVETVDGEPARTSARAGLLIECGFRSELRGLGYETGVR